MITLAPKTWSPRLIPTGNGKSPGAEAKHQRWIFCPDDGLIWDMGGDWNDTVGGGSGQQQIYAYDVALDDGLGSGLGWIKADDFCAVVGTAKPASMDQVTAAYDTKRKVIWCLPGYMPGNEYGAFTTKTLAVPLSQGGNETTLSVQESLQPIVDAGITSSSIVIVDDNLEFEYMLYDGIDTASTPNKFLGLQRGFGGTPRSAHSVGTMISRGASGTCGPRTTVRPSLPWTGFTWDPINRVWQIRSKIRVLGGGESSANGFYDEVLDKVIRIRGSSTVEVQWFSLPSLSIQSFTFSGLGLNSVPIGNNDIAWDPEGRVAYIIQPGSSPSTMLMYRPDTNTMTKATGTGVPPRATIAQADGSGDGTDCFYPRWDSINKVILWPFVYKFSGGTEDLITTPTSITRLYIYHPTTNTWEVDAMLPGGPPYQRGNAWVFNPKENLLMGMGRSDGQMWLYRYASTAPAFRPIGVSAVIR